MKSKNMLMKLINKIPVGYALLLIALVFYGIAGAIMPSTSAAENHTSQLKSSETILNCHVECQFGDSAILGLNTY